MVADLWMVLHIMPLIYCSTNAMCISEKSMGNGDCERKLFYAQINCTPSKQLNQTKMLLTHVPTECSAEKPTCDQHRDFHTYIYTADNMVPWCKTRARIIWSVFHAWNTFCSVVCGLDIICCFYFVWLVVGILSRRPGFDGCMFVEFRHYQNKMDEVSQSICYSSTAFAWSLDCNYKISRNIYHLTGKRKTTKLRHSPFCISPIDLW